jgi:hypothetical protein
MSMVLGNERLRFVKVARHDSQLRLGHPPMLRAASIPEMPRDAVSKVKSALRHEQRHLGLRLGDPLAC